MLKAKDSLTETTRKTLLAQAVLTGIAAIVALLVKSPGFALHVIYGGAVVGIGTALQAWRLLKIAAPGDDDNPIAAQGNAGAEVFKGVLLKIGSMIALLALGMGYLKLDALAVLIGFIIAYSGLLFARGYAPRSK